MYADIIIKNGRCVTMCGDGGADWVAAAGKMICAAGRGDDWQKLVRPGTQVIDARGGTVLPGFIDNHFHVMQTAVNMMSVDLGGARSHRELGEMLAAAEKREGAVLGCQVEESQFEEKRFPDRYVLDKYCSDSPVVLFSKEYHVSMLNTHALLYYKVPFSLEGVELDGSGLPTGIFRRNANYVLRSNVLRSLPDEFRMEAIHLAMSRLLENGITTCQEGATTADFAALFCGLANKGLLKMDVVSYPMYGEDVDKILADHEPFVSQDYTGHFRIGGLKMFFDGSPQGRTAWMTEPYTPGDEGEGYCGYGTMTDKAAYDFMRKAIDGNHQLLAHTNGDAAADQYLRVYKRALEDSPNPDKASLHPVMIHCQTARRDQYEQMAEINMIPSIFASHIWYWADVHLKNFGPVRGGRVSACHDALECGLPFTFHTDTPVLRPNFFEAVWCAAKRVTKGGAQLDENQKISVYEGLKAITVNGAFQYGELDRKGTLEAGKLADFCIVEKNPLKIELDEVRNLRVLETVKEGETVWTRK